MCWGKQTQPKKRNNVNWLHTYQTDLKRCFFTVHPLYSERFTVASKLERSMQHARSHVQVLNMFQIKAFSHQAGFLSDRFAWKYLKNKWLDGFLLPTSLSADFCLQRNMFNQWSVLFLMMSSSEWETTTSTTRSRTISVWRSVSSWDTKTKVMQLIFTWWCHEEL